MMISFSGYRKDRPKFGAAHVTKLRTASDSSFRNVYERTFVCTYAYEHYSQGLRAVEGVLRTSQKCSAIFM
jgi:hypothetical protein